jgi:hypothetical protein
VVRPATHDIVVIRVSCPTAHNLILVWNLLGGEGDIKEIVVGKFSFHNFLPCPGVTSLLKIDVAGHVWVKSGGALEVTPDIAFEVKGLERGGP